MQWIWGDVGGSTGGGDRLVICGGNSADDKGCGESDGLYSIRTAFVLLGPSPPATGDGDGNSDGGRSDPSINVSRVLASRVDGMRRRASQLKVTCFPAF